LHPYNVDWYFKPDEIELVQDSDTFIDNEQQEDVNKELTVREVCEWVGRFGNGDVYLELHPDMTGDVRDYDGNGVIGTYFHDIEELTELVRKPKDLEIKVVK